MNDRVPIPSLDASVAWLAAYALGLAYSDNSDKQRLSDLIEAARDHPDLLEAASRRLDGAEVAERSICDDALRLLDGARVRAAEDQPRAASAVPTVEVRYG